MTKVQTNDPTQTCTQDGAHWPATPPPSQNRPKMRQILARTREGSRAIFQKNWTKLSVILFPVFSALLLYFWLAKNICSSLVCKSNDTKNCPISLMNEKNIGKRSMIGTSFGMWYKEKKLRETRRNWVKPEGIATRRNCAERNPKKLSCVIFPL